LDGPVISTSVRRDADDGRAAGGDVDERRRDRQREVLRLPTGDESVAVQRSTAQRQILHRNHHLADIRGHGEVEERIAAGSAGALNREDIVGQRLIAGRSELLSCRVANRDDALQTRRPQFARLQFED
jgi:hypothetical protein